MQVFAHRGASGAYPENTMLAFRKAIEMGAHGIETDVNLTKDGQLILCHDETIDATTDGVGWIGEMSAAELARVDAGRWKGEQFAGERLPLLRELLTLGAQSGITLNLELKNYLIPYPGMEELVLAEVARYYTPDKVILSSFKHSSMRLAKQLEPRIRTGLLYCCDLVQPGQYARLCLADALHPDFTTLSVDTMQDAKAHGLAVNVYTVDADSDIRRMFDLGVDVVMTNYPDRALACVAALTK